MNIHKVTEQKRRYMDLLLIGDEQENMIERYLEGGDLFVGSVDGKAVAVCMAEVIGDGKVEIKNIAVHPDYRRRGYGRSLLNHVEEQYAGAEEFLLGTGETPSTLEFYRRCGYSYSHRIHGFFTAFYDHPIVEEGVTLCDMIYLKKLK